MLKPIIICVIVLGMFMGCTQPDTKSGPRRFFSDDSFWNQPIEANPEIDARNDEWIALFKTETNTQNIGVNAFEWTIPVYEVDENTPTYTIHKHTLSPEEQDHWDVTHKTFGHGPGFGENVPVPSDALPDPEEDAHFAVVDWDRMLAWDMWGFRIREDGSYESNTGMVYPLDGDGVFNTQELGVQNGESVHFYGPSRAAGVPAIAGLIMYDEVMAGKIEHKIAMATRFARFQEFVYPAAWTDGYYPNGIPEGAVVQLDPDLDLSPFDLTDGERVVARALQEYGAVIVDVAQGSPVYAEGLWGHPDKSWDGIFRGWEKGLCDIPIDHYRVLDVGETVKMGDARSLKHPYWDE